MTIGTRIKEYRTKSKLSQEKVAELVGVSRHAVTKWESDQSTPNMDNLFRLAEIFGTTVDALVTDETHKGTVAELVYHMIQEEEQRKRKALREKLRLRIRDGLAVLGCYLVIFLISKLLWADRENFSLMGWLTNTWYEHHAPCFGWILVHKWFWSAAFFSVAMALLGFRRISLITIVGCALGLLLGEYTGTGYVLVDDGDGVSGRYISAYGEYAGAAKMVADRKDFDGDIVVISYALTRYDRVTGEKLMTWDGEKKLHFLDEMTVQEVVETGLRYFRALESKETVPYEEVLPFDETIITPELLSRETTLPEASSSHLPDEWHGIYYTYSAKMEDHALESDIQTIKDAGFNFIRCALNFTHFYGFNPEEGKIHEGRMKELDQLLAWCMERDIHLNISLYWNYDWPDGFSSDQLVRQTKYSKSIADTWTVFARRYADIPGQYLSFTLLDHAWGSTDEENGAFLSPAAEAVQKISPCRCIIAKVGQGEVSGAAIASKGVALTSNCTWGEDFYFTDYYSDRKSAMQKAVWPYEEDGEIVDGNAALSKNTKGKAKNAPDAVAATAREHGVGYMVCEWGPRREWYGLIAEDVRYSDDTMQAYLTDMTQTMKERGYGWCYTDWMGCVGLTFCYPLVKDSAYTQVREHLYVDEEMSGWFKEINGVQ